MKTITCERCQQLYKTKDTAITSLVYCEDCMTYEEKLHHNEGGTHYGVARIKIDKLVLPEEALEKVKY